MSLPTPSSRHRRSLSSLLYWNRYNSIPPILFAGDEDHFQRERHRELQFTLDKLEGRIRVTPEGHFRRVGFEDPALDDVCGLMSMLGDDFVNTNDDQGVEENGFGDLNYHAISDWAARQSSTGSGDPHGGPICGDNNESDGVRWMATGAHGGVAMEVPRNITHPAFSWSPDTEEKWDTSSRVSEDSFFDEHTRCPPEPGLKVTWKAVGRLSPPGAGATIPLYRDSLCSKILSESWPKLYTKFRSSEDVPFMDNSNFTPFEEPRALSYTPPFDPCSTTLAQARHVFPEKPSFIKKVINIIAHPTKMLASRNKMPLVNIPSESRNSSGNGSGNYEVASSYPSGSSKSAGKKVVFNDTVGYRVFCKDSLCTVDH